MVHERGSGGQFYGVKVKEDSDMEKGLTGLWIFFERVYASISMYYVSGWPCLLSISF